MLPDPSPRFRRNLRYSATTLVFLAPWLAVFLTFSVYPILHSAFLSFTRYKASGLKPPAWIGWDNYVALFGNRYFLKALYNSFAFVAGTVPATIAAALALATVLNRNMKGRAFYRTAFFMPTVASLFVVATLFLEIYAQDGHANQLLESLGFQPLPWLRHPDTALFSIMLMNVWTSFGFYSILLLAGLQGIPATYYEASSIEGAGKLRQFFTITLPLLKPTLLVATVINCILAFQVFGEIYVMTQGGPLRSTETAVYHIYHLGFEKQRMGRAAAAAYVVFALLLGFSLFQAWLYQDKRNR